VLAALVVSELVEQRVQRLGLAVDVTDDVDRPVEEWLDE